MLSHGNNELQTRAMLKQGDEKMLLMPTHVT